jgi:hypothetical protein
MDKATFEDHMNNIANGNNNALRAFSNAELRHFSILFGAYRAQIVEKIQQTRSFLRNDQKSPADRVEIEDKLSRLARLLPLINRVSRGYNEEVIRRRTALKRPRSPPPDEEDDMGADRDDMDEEDGMGGEDRDEEDDMGADRDDMDDTGAGRMRGGQFVQPINRKFLPFF